MSDKVILIGLDGITFDLIGKWLQDGYLPGLKGLIDDGAAGELQSTIPPVTPTAIASLITGQNPGKHGIYDFFHRNWGETEWRPVNASLRDGPAFWDILGRAGKNCMILGVPLTYPPTPVNGLMVSGFLTPKGKRDFTYPPHLVDEIEERFGPYRLHLEQSFDGHDPEPILREVLDELDYKFEVALYLLRKYDWDVAMLYIMGTDRVQHELWQFLQESSDQDHQTRFLRIMEYYQAIDLRLSELLSDVGDDVTIIVFSDHGFGAIKKFLNFNIWLLEEGFLTLKADRRTRLKRWLHKLGVTPLNAYRGLSLLKGKNVSRERDLESRSRMVDWMNELFLSFQDVDWQRTRAYSRGNFGQIFVNLGAREPHGCVETEERDAVVNQICSRLEQVQVGDDLISFDLYKKDDVYLGPHVDAAPEIVPIPKDMTLKALGTLAFPSNKFVDGNTYGLSGDHRPNGVLICRGGPLAKGTQIIGAQIMDLAPTVLYLMGQDVPVDMDGRVLTEIFTEEFLKAHPLRRCEYRFDIIKQDAELSEDEVSGIKDRLRGLGYLG